MRYTTIILNILFVFFFSVASLAAQDGEAEAPQLSVEGIMYDNANPIAVVNDQLLKKGDTIEGAQIVEISGNSVTFQRGDKIFTKEVGEGARKSSFKNKIFSGASLGKGICGRFGNIKSREDAEKVVRDIVLKLWPILLTIVLVVYIYMSVTLRIIANKTGTTNGWMAWIPIANIFLMCMIADKSFLWILILLIPFGQIIFSIVMWTGISEACEKPWWVGLLAIIPGVNFVVAGYLAFSKITENV